MVPESGDVGCGRKRQQVVRTPEGQTIIDHISRGRSEPLTQQEINLALMQAWAIGDLDQEPTIIVR
jgi:hypothetical protein